MLAVSEMFTPPAHPVLSFSELALSLGQRCLVVGQAPLRLFLKPQPGLAARVPDQRGQLVIDECRDGSAH
ncbi:MAG TPA: hypothetical protein VJ948_04400 [Acidimicrobiia bacterium]|nr:hypothetical protein [Acidimicrobiia bacterium]